mgnify:FL=1
MAPAPYLPNNHIPGINGASGVDNLTRRDNSFVYESPSFGGLKLSAMVSLGEQNKLNSESEMSNKYGNSYAAQASIAKAPSVSALLTPIKTWRQKLRIISRIRMRMLHCIT